MTREEFMRQAGDEIDAAFRPQRNRLINMVERAWAEGKRAAEVDALRQALGEAMAKIEGPVAAEDEHEEMGLQFGECGGCHNAIRRPWKYCPACGRAVKWK